MSGLAKVKRIVPPKVALFMCQAVEGKIVVFAEHGN